MGVLWRLSHRADDDEDLSSLPESCPSPAAAVARLLGEEPADRDLVEMFKNDPESVRLESTASPSSSATTSSNKDLKAHQDARVAEARR